jgi:tetratricopeptide (TPR) repeat protein
MELPRWTVQLVLIAAVVCGPSVAFASQASAKSSQPAEKQTAKQPAPAQPSSKPAATPAKGPAKSSSASRATQTAKSLCDKAAALVAVENFQEAAATYRKAIAAKADYAPAQFGLADVYFERIGDSGAAIDAYQQALKLEPQNQRALAHLGSALMEKERYEEALMPLGEALRLKPGDGAALYDLGQAEARRCGAGRVSTGGAA